MAEVQPISLGIELKVITPRAELEDRLTRVAELMDRIRGPVAKTAVAFKEQEGQVRKLVTTAKEAPTIWAGLGITIEDVGRRQEFVTRTTEELTGALTGLVRKEIEAGDKISIYLDILTRYSTGQITAAEMTEEFKERVGRLTPMMVLAKDQTALLAEFARRLGIDLGTLVVGLLLSEKGLSKVAIASKLASEMLDQIRIYSTLGTGAQQMLQQATGRTHEELIKLEQQLRATTTSLAAVRDMGRQFYAILGPAGVAARALARELFWTGLSAMFITMSLARAFRAMERSRRAAYTLARAHVRIEEAQREYNEIVRRYGPASEQARRASLALKDAQMSLEDQIASTRMSIEMQNLSWLMLIFGTLPSFLRTGSAVIDMMIRQYAMTQNVTGATWQEILAKLVSTEVTGAETTAKVVSAGAGELEAAATRSQIAAKLKLIPVVGGAMAAVYKFTGSLTAAFIATQLLTGAITMGIGVLISWGIAHLVTQRQIAEMEDRVRKLRKELTGSGLVGAIEETIQITKEWGYITSKTVKDLPLKASSPLEIKTTWGGWVEMPELLASPEIELERISPTPTQVTIINYGPWYIREEADIYKITREQNRRLLRGIRLHGGYFLR